MRKMEICVWELTNKYIKMNHLQVLNQGHLLKDWIWQVGSPAKALQPGLENENEWAFKA